MKSNDALNDISLSAEPKEQRLNPKKDIWLSYLARVFFAYLPLVVYFIVNIDVDEKVIPLINDAMQELFRLVEQANEQGAGLDYGDEKRKILECY